jgi:hypothetical protein
VNAATVVGWIVIGLVALALAAALLFGLWLLAGGVWRAFTPGHWSFIRPRFGRPSPWRQVANPDAVARGNRDFRHPSTIRRLLGFGPFVIWAVRYKPGMPGANPTRED